MLISLIFLRGKNGAARVLVPASCQQISRQESSERVIENRCESIY